MNWYKQAKTRMDYDTLQNELLLLAHHIEDAQKNVGISEDIVRSSLGDMMEVATRLMNFLPARAKENIASRLSYVFKTAKILPDESHAKKWFNLNGSEVQDYKVLKPGETCQVKLETVDGTKETWNWSADNDKSGWKYVSGDSQ